MAKKDDRLFIRLHEGMPEHPKIEGLSDKAFRLLVETWCWCARNRTDGHVVSASWKKRGTAKARKELIEAGLFDDDLTGGAIAHDWDSWQRTAQEIEEAKANAAADGLHGAHQRWHVKRGIRETDCSWCKSMPSAIGNR